MSEIDRLREEMRELRDSAEMHRILIDTTNTGYVILDEIGRVLDANAEYVKLTGHERLDQILGRRVTEWTCAEDRDRNDKEVGRCIESGQVRNLEIDYCGPDGKRRPIEINATVRTTATGRTIFTICRDITTRKWTEEALRNSEQRYRTTIDSMGEAIHVVDADLRIELLNHTGECWMHNLGISSELVGKGIFEVFPFLPDSVREEYRRVFAGESPLITEEINTVGGVEVVTETRKIPIFEGGKVARVVTVIRDITDIVRNQQRLRQTEKMEALGRLAGGIAHDFNNQLFAILALAELLERGIQEPGLREYAKTIARAAQRSADLTRQLLDFSRKDSARVVPFDLHDVLEGLAEMLRRTIDPRIEICCQLEAPCAWIVGDPALIQSAILNLALNARDAMPKGGRLTLTTDVIDGSMYASVPNGMSAEQCLRVRVSDDGCGMNEEVCRHVFEPFFTTKEQGSGTGIGLATVYSTITKHQGVIKVDSEPGEGTCFTIVLPLQVPPHADGLNP